jgi:hypothetical protein
MGSITEAPRSNLMSHAFPLNMRRACAWVALVGLVALVACGGGAEPSAPAVPQTISFDAPANPRFGTAGAALVASASSGLPVTLTSTTPGVCAVSGTTLTMTAAGSCSVVAEQPGNVVYAAAEPVTRAFVVAPGAQSITFVSPGNQTLGTPPAALVASATSGLVVAFSSGTPAVCAINGTSLSLLGAGTCTVTARQVGNANYAAANNVAYSVDVKAALLPQSINFAPPGEQTLGTPAAALAATATSGLVVTLTSMTPAVCTVSGTTLTLIIAGTCTTTASQGGDSVYAAATMVQRSITVSAAPQVITFAAPGNQTLGSAAPALSASATSGLPVSLASTTPAVCSVSGTTLTLVAIGSCSLQASQAGNASYAAATPVTRTLSVTAPALIAQTITFAAPGNQTLGNVPAALLASASSGLPVTLLASTPSVCSVSGSTLTLLALGTCTVSASQTGNSAFAAAPSVSRSFAVLAAPLLAQTITFAGPGNQVLGTPPPPLVAAASSGLPVSLVSTTPSVCSVAGTNLSLIAVGTCIVNADQAGNSSYAAAATVSRVITITSAPLVAQTITFSGPGNQTLGTAAPPLVASASSGLVVTFTSTTPSVCTVSGITLGLVTAGTCAIEASQAGNGTYAAAATVSRVFLVAPVPLITQTINFTGPGDQTLGAAPIALNASATSGLPVSFSSTTGGVCSVSGSTLTLLAVGSCSVEARQAGNAAFAAATPVTRTLNVVAVALLSQTISFAGPGDQVLGTAPPSLVATASSGLPVSIASLTTNVCTTSGSTLTLLTTGTCSLLASQSGGAGFAAAPDVTRSFQIAAPAIELFANGGFETAGTTTPADAWLSAAGGYTRNTSDSRSGGASAQLSSPAFNAAVMLQNSVEQGLRPALVVGSTPVLRFWAKGTAGGTGNVLFALRYLDAVGNIKANSGNQFFESRINTTTWTQISYSLGPVPAGAVAAFIEFSQAIGPIDATNPAGKVLIDDLSLQAP